VRRPPSAAEVFLFSLGGGDFSPHVMTWPGLGLQPLKKAFITNARPLSDATTLVLHGGWPRQFNDHPTTENRSGGWPSLGPGHGFGCRSIKAAPTHTSATHKGQYANDILARCNRSGAAKQNSVRHPPSTAEIFLCSLGGGDFSPHVITCPGFGLQPLKKASIKPPHTFVIPATAGRFSSARPFMKALWGVESSAPT